MSNELPDFGSATDQLPDFNTAAPTAPPDSIPDFGSPRVPASLPVQMSSLRPKVANSFEFNPATAPKPVFTPNTQGGLDISNPQPVINPNLESTTRGSAAGQAASRVEPLLPSLTDLKSAAGEVSDYMKFGEAGDGQNKLTKNAIDYQIQVHPDDSPAVATGKEAANILMSVPEFLTSPFGVASTATGGALPRTVSALFAGDMLKNLGEQTLDTYKNWRNMTPGQQSAAIVDMVGSGAFAGLLGAHTLHKAPVSEIQAQEAAPEENAPPKGLVSGFTFNKVGDNTHDILLKDRPVAQLIQYDDPSQVPVSTTAAPQAGYSGFDALYYQRDPNTGSPTIYIPKSSLGNPVAPMFTHETVHLLSDLGVVSKADIQDVANQFGPLGSDYRNNLQKIYDGFRTQNGMTPITKPELDEEIFANKMQEWHENQLNGEGEQPPKLSFIQRAIDFTRGIFGLKPSSPSGTRAVQKLTGGDFNAPEPLPMTSPVGEAAQPNPPVEEPTQFQSGGALKSIGGLNAKFGDTSLSVIPSPENPKIGFVTGLVGKDVASKLDDISAALKQAGFESIDYRPDNEDGRGAARVRLFKSLQNKFQSKVSEAPPVEEKAPELPVALPPPTVIPPLPPPLEPKPPTAGFTTSKGSQYTVDNNGWTTRLKKSPGKGQGETHEPMATVFITPDSADELMQAGQSGERMILSDASGNQIRPSDGQDIRGLSGLKVVTTDKSGKVTGEFPATTIPEVGKHPFDIAYQGEQKRYHLGNKITEVSPQPPVEAPLPPPQAPEPVAKEPLTAQSEHLEPEEISDMTPGEFTTYIRSKPGGLTQEAYRVGRSIQDTSTLRGLKEGQEKSAAASQAFQKAKDFNSGMIEAARGQFFREAYEAATGTGSAGLDLSKDPTYKPPFPQNKTPETKIVQTPVPEKFNSVQDVLKFKQQRLDEEKALYKEQIGLTDAEADKLADLMSRDASLEKFEKTLTPEKAKRVEWFFEESPFNQKGHPFQFWEHDKNYRPESLEYEDDKDHLATSLISALVKGIDPAVNNDRFLYAAMAANRLKEIGATKSDLLRSLDSYTTRNSGDQHDKAFFFKHTGEKLNVFLESQGVNLPAGEFGAKAKPEPAPLVLEQPKEVAKPKRGKQSSLNPKKMSSLGAEPENQKNEVRIVRLDDGRILEVHGSGAATYWREKGVVNKFSKGNFLLASPEFRKQIESSEPISTTSSDWRKSFDSTDDIERKIDWLRAVANKKSTAADLADALARTEKLLETQEHSRLGNTLWDIAHNPAASPETKARAQSLYDKPTEQPAAKEAWQMTLSEFAAKELERYKDKITNGEPYSAVVNPDFKKNLPKMQKELKTVPPEKQLDVFKKNWENYHKDKVELAIEDGKPVPPEVLADYPDLKPAAKEEPKPAEPAYISPEELMARQPKAEPSETVSKLEAEEQAYMKSKGIVEEDANGNYITKEKNGTYKVWRAGNTVAELAGTIGFKGAKGLEKAKTRLAELTKEPPPGGDGGTPKPVEPTKGPTGPMASVKRNEDSIELTKDDAQEILHKLSNLADNQDLLSDYGLTEDQGKEIAATVPHQGGTWRIPLYAAKQIAAELADHASVLRDIADDARSGGEPGQALRISKQAKRFEDQIIPIVKSFDPSEPKFSVKKPEDVEEGGGIGNPDDAVAPETLYHQTAGVPNLGTEYTPESVKATQDAVRQTRFTSQGPITPAKTGEFFRWMDEFTNPTTRAQTMRSLVDDVKSQTKVDTAELAPALFYSELRDYATRLMARGNPEPLLHVINSSNEFATVADVVTSAGARALRGLQEGEGKLLLQSLYKITKDRIETEGGKLGVNKELFGQLIDSLNGAKVDADELEQAVRTGKNEKGQTIDQMVGAVEESKVKETAPRRVARAKQQAESDADKVAKQKIDELQRKRGAEWLKPDAPPKAVDAVTKFIKDYLRGRLPDDPIKNPVSGEDYQRPIPSTDNADMEARKVADGLESIGVSKGSAIVLAHELIQEREVNWGNKREQQIQQAANNRNLRSLVESILTSPFRAQSDPAWLKETAMNWFMDTGLSREQAEAATRLFDQQFKAAFSKAQERIAQQVLKAGHPKALEQVVKMVRSGLFDLNHPDFTPFAAKLGLKGFSVADFQKLAELDEKLSQPIESYPERVMLTDQMLSIIRRNRPTPSVMQALAANYSISLLTAVRTHTIHLFAGAFHILEERVLGTLSHWPTSSNLKLLWKPMVQAARNFTNQWRFAAGAGMSYFPVRELEAGENILRKLWEDGSQDIQSKDMKVRARGLLKMLGGVQDFSARILNASNQANVVAIRDAQLPLYGSLTFKELGLNPKAIDAMVESLAGVRQQAYTDAIDRGLKGAQAKVAADDIASRYLAHLFGQATKDPDAVRRIWASAESDGLSAVGRLAKNIPETGEGGLVSRYLGGHWLVKMANKMRAESTEGKIGALYFFGYVGVPYRMARFLAWNSYYGLVRIGIHKFRQSQGWDNWWKQSLGTKYQEQYRLRMALAASAAMTLLLAGGATALGKRQTTDKNAGKDDFAWYVTGNGPQNKDLRDAWTRLGFQPNSLTLVMRGGVHISVPITRVGESLGELLWGLSAQDDYAWRKKEQESTGKTFNESELKTAFEAVGNYASIIGERGPLQQILQSGQSERTPQMTLASAAGKLLAPVVPFSGLQRSVRDLIVGQVDYSTPEAAFLANFPVLGWTGSSQAINRLGDPLYDHSWYAKMARTGIPIAFGTQDTGLNQKIYQAIVDQGAALPALRRSEIEDKFGPLTQDQWNQFAVKSGALVKQAITSSLPAFQSGTPQQARQFVVAAAKTADQQTASNMGLVPEVKSSIAGARPARQAPAQSTPRSGRVVSSLRPRAHTRLLHAGTHHAMRTRTMSSLRSHHRHSVFS